MYWLIYVVNFVLACLLLRYNINSTSDKSGFLTFLVYSALVTMNLVLALTYWLDSNERKTIVHEHYFYSAIMLLMVALLFAMLF
jgi:hypothetical protein